MEYLTPADFEAAEKNGIHEKLLKNRFYIYGWSKRRAITQPVRKRNIHEEHREQAKANGINASTFSSRIIRGWDHELACTAPIGYKRPRKRKITDEHLAIAKANGIKPMTVWSRVHNLFWPIEKAITTPSNQKFNWRAK